MPKTTNKLFSALAPWNAWDGPSPYTGISRDITPTLLPLIERPEALVLTGIRRGGKSTIMFRHLLLCQPSRLDLYVGVVARCVANGF
jgi:hypothetical protein